MGDGKAGAGSSHKTCPSSSCHEGAQLLGIMTSSGRLAYVNPPTPVDAEFVARASAQGSPERRFRFADTCIEGGCPQWTGSGCGVADLAADAAVAAPAKAAQSLPACSIRRTCRWFFQRGPAACAACPLLVADMGGTETYSSLHPNPGAPQEQQV